MYIYIYKTTHTDISSTNTGGSQGPFFSNLGSRQGAVKRCFKAPPELSAEVIPAAV